jgi:hypothetical protein
MLRAFHYYHFSIPLVDALGGLTEMYFLIVWRERFKIKVSAMLNAPEVSLLGVQSKSSVLIRTSVILD